MGGTKEMKKHAQVSKRGMGKKLAEKARRKRSSSRR